MEALLLGAAVVATTDVDDPVLLSAMFADPRLRAARSVVAGQFLGILALTGASELAAPAEWVALLAVVLVFLVLTGLLCAASFALVRNPVLGERIARWGRRALPWVLIAPGLVILWGARGLLGA